MLDGKYLNQKEHNFVSKVIKDVDLFLENCIKENIHNVEKTCHMRKSKPGAKTFGSTASDSCIKKDRVLLFPPFTARGRFLVHKTVEENFLLLTTFSVGVEPFRRTAVTWSSLLERRKKDKQHSSTYQRKDLYLCGKETGTNYGNIHREVSVRPIQREFDKAKGGVDASRHGLKCSVVRTDTGVEHQPNPTLDGNTSLFSDILSSKDTVNDFPLENKYNKVSGIIAASHNVNSSVLAASASDSNLYLKTFNKQENICRVVSSEITQYSDDISSRNRELKSNNSKRSLKTNEISHSQCVNTVSDNSGNDTLVCENKSGKRIKGSSNRDVSGVKKCRKDSNPVNCIENFSKTITKCASFTESGENLCVSDKPNFISVSNCEESVDIKLEASNRRITDTVQDFKNCSINKLNIRENSLSMSVDTMVAEADSSFNRRRARESTQIYRPPPARSTKVNGATEDSFYDDQLLHQQQYLKALKQYQNNLEQNRSYHEPMTSRNNAPHTQHNYIDSDMRQRSRRPDQQFYVPRRRRLPEDSTPCSTPTPYEEPQPRAPSPTNSICSVVSEFSGRNRYNKQVRQSRYHDDDRVHGKPPISFNRESAHSEKTRSKPSLFASETLQLIERCINYDSNKTSHTSPENSPANRNWEKGNHKGIHSWDNHPVHSKENFMHPFESNQRSRKGRRNRKRGSKSRDQSLEHKGNYNRRGSISNENLIKTFYNSNSGSYERYSIDRMGSRNSSRASSRNPSIERTPFENQAGYEWRIKGYSTPTSPVKHFAPLLDKTPRRHSLGKPPLVKNMYNVHVDSVSTSSCEYDRESYSVSRTKNHRHYDEETSYPVPETATDTSDCHYDRETSPASDSYPLSKSRDNNFEEEQSSPCNVREIPRNEEVSVAQTFDLGENTNLIDSFVELNSEESSDNLHKDREDLTATITTNTTSLNRLLEKGDSTTNTFTEYLTANDDSTISTVANVSNTRDIAGNPDLLPINNEESSNTLARTSIAAKELEESVCTSNDSLLPNLILESLSINEEENSLLSTTHIVESFSGNDLDLSSTQEISHGASDDINKNQASVNLSESEASDSLNEYQASDTLNDSQASDSLKESQVSEAIIEEADDKGDTSQECAELSSASTPVKKEESNPRIFSFNWADEVNQGDDDSWDTLYDDSGNYLHGSVKKDLEDSIGKIKLEKPACDYYEFEPQENHVVDDELGHIIEIYDFPASFQTQDLLTIFQDFKGFDLRWVDDTHALGIFVTSLVAADSLNLVHPFVKTRPLSKGIEASKLKAIRAAERLPFKPRPETSVALARRLVTGALGLKVEVSKEQRDAERQKLRKAKEKKRLIAKQKEDAWEGTFNSN